MKTVAAVLAVVAAGLIAAGLIVGFGVSVTDSGGFHCGSAFKESGDLFTDELTETMTGGSGESNCDAARGSAKPLPIVLLVLGGVAGVGSLIVGIQAKEATVSPRI